MKSQGGKPSLKGLGQQNFPSPNEKSKPSKGGSISGTGKGAGLMEGNPLNATYDSRPHPGDNKPGATRSKGGK